MLHLCFAIGCYILGYFGHSTVVVVVDSRYCFDRNTTATGLVGSTAVDCCRSIVNAVNQDHIAAAADSCSNRSTIDSSQSIVTSHNTVGFTTFDQKERSFLSCHLSCSLSSSNLLRLASYTADITGATAGLAVGLPSGKPTSQTLPLSRRVVAVVRQPLDSSVYSHHHHRSHEG